MNKATNTTPSPRGFAAMDQKRQREIASEGGKAAHLKGTAHEFTSEEARAAGSKSHQSSKMKKSNYEENSTAAGGFQSPGQQSKDQERESRT